MKLISKSIINLDPNDQKKIDDVLLKLDGSENKKNLGANSLLAVSLAVRKAAITLNNENYFDYKKSVSLPQHFRCKLAVKLKRKRRNISYHK